MDQLDTINRDVFFREQINVLRDKKNAIIMAHYYQVPEIQDVADYIGDSLGLSKQAAETDADLIVFAGVHFMAETAKILSPQKKVIIPDINAGCSLADSCTADSFKSFIGKYPDHVVITYVNCSAEVKALSDLVCTSSNALQIVNSIPAKTPIIFAPDKNLGKYINKLTGRNMVLWDGSCIVHEAFSIDKILELHLKHPDAEIIAHPESEEHVLKVASYIGSTSGMIKYVKTSPVKKFIVGTEVGILHEMKLSVPGKVFIPAPSLQDNTCACSQCEYMKVNTLEKLYNCLRDESPEIMIPEKIRIHALEPIQKMLEISC